MFYTLLAVTALLVPSPTLALVDCHVACTRCRQRDEHHPGVLEVYCAMCRECTDRRREQTLRRQQGAQVIYNVDNYPEDCPTPPPCEEEPEYVPASPLDHTMRLTSTTPASTATTTTTRRPCPEITGCKPRQRPPPLCYYPCVPACPCPEPGRPPSTAPPPGELYESPPTASTHRTQGYLYVYVGVPKQMLQKYNQGPVAA